MLQVQQLGWAAQRNLDLEEGWKLTEEHLQHSGINVDGVVHQIRRRLEHVSQGCTGYHPQCLQLSSNHRTCSVVVYVLRSWLAGMKLARAACGTRASY